VNELEVQVALEALGDCVEESGLELPDLDGRRAMKNSVP